MKKILLIAITAVTLSACVKQALQTTYDKQTNYIESFISSQISSDETATLTRNGGAYRLTLHDTLDVARDSLAWGQRVSLRYACFTLTSSSITTSNLVSTNIEEIATQAKWELKDKSLFKLDTITVDGSLVKGLGEGLIGVQPADEGYILFTGKYGYGKTERGTIPAMSALAYYILIEEILPNE